MEFAHEWNGAVWHFSSTANRELFKATPEKYAPEYGGHCALGASEGYISQKPTNGQYAIFRGKLYLFPPGRTPQEVSSKKIVEPA